MAETLPLAAPASRRVTKPLTVDPQTRSVLAIISAGAPVGRIGPRPDGAYGRWTERLDVRGVDLSRAPGAALLIDHVASAAAQVGVVERAEVRGGEVVAELRFGSGPFADNYFRDVQDGTKRGLSIGYSVEEWSADRNDPDTFTATKWTLLEVSVVAVPADPAAGFRSLQLEGHRVMTERHSTAAEGAPSMTRAGAAAGFTGAPQPPAVPDPVVAERHRVTEIHRCCSVARLDRAVADRLVAEGVPLEAARAAIIDQLAREQEPRNVRNVSVIGIGTDHGDPAAIRGRMADALAHRLSGGSVALPEASRTYAGLGLLDLYRELAETRSPGSTRRLSRQQLMDGMLSRDSGGMMSTSDFPNLLAAAANKALLSTFQALAPALVAVARRSTAPDFKPIYRLRIGETPQLLLVPEHSEILSGTVGEHQESYSIKSYGRRFAFTRQAIVNDDLQAFQDFLGGLGRAAAGTLGDLLASTLTSNPALSDGTPLFHANHGNLAPAGSAISVTSLGAGRARMRKQVGVDGRPIEVKPKYLVVSPDKETEAEQALTAILAANAASVNPFVGQLTLVVDPRLTGNTWYIFADPALVPVLEYAELDASRPLGASGPQVMVRPGWEVDGLEARVSYDVGVGLVGWQGAHRDPGA